MKLSGTQKNTGESTDTKISETRVPEIEVRGNELDVTRVCLSTSPNVHLLSENVIYL